MLPEGGGEGSPCCRKAEREARLTTAVWPLLPTHPALMSQGGSRAKKLPALVLLSVSEILALMEPQQEGSEEGSPLTYGIEPVWGRELGEAKVSCSLPSFLLVGPRAKPLRAGSGHDFLIASTS